MDGDDFHVTPLQGDLEAISSIYSKLQTSDPRVIDVREFARQIGQLKAFPHRDHLCDSWAISRFWNLFLPTPQNRLILTNR